MTLAELGTLLLAFAPVVAGLAWLGYLIFRKDLASQTIGRIFSYFLGVIVIFFGVGWLIDTFLISWVNERLQSTQNSTELRELNDTIDTIIQESINREEQGGSAPQPTPVIVTVTVTPGPSGGPQLAPPESAAPVSPPVAGPREHVVVAGDTLSRIAQTYGTTVNDL